MKLFQLNATANWGSTGKIAEGIGQSAIARGWESFIAFGRYAKESDSNLIRVGSKADVYKHYALHRLFDKEGFGSKAATKNLINHIDDIKPDIIQLHNIHDHWLNHNILFDYLQSINTPAVWTFHDCWPFTGGCYHFVENNCYNWKSGCKNCEFRKGLFNHSERNFKFKSEHIRSIKNRLHIVSVSHWLDSMVGESVMADLNHSVIYNGVDTNLFSFVSTDFVSEKYKLNNKFVILGVSSVWPKSKGLEDFIRLRQFLNEDFLIVLVGLPKSVIADLPKGILGIERTSDNTELISLYNRADVVVSFSRGETFGLTLVEGQSCGTPSIVYANTALNEIVTDQSGFKVETGDVEKAAERIIYLKNKKPFSPEICRNRIIREFNKEQQFNKYIDLYENLLS